MKLCIRCASEIPDAAKACVHCGGYQDWRRYFSIGSILIPLLSFLLAAVSLIMSNLEKISNIINPPRPYISAYFGNSDVQLNHSLVGTYVNIGSAPGVVGGAINCFFPEIRDLYEIQVLFSKPSIVPPLSSATISAKVFGTERWNVAGVDDGTGTSNYAEIEKYFSNMRDDAVNNMHVDTIAFWNQADEEQSALVKPHIIASLEGLIKAELVCASTIPDLSDITELNAAVARAAARSVWQNEDLFTDASR